MNKVVLFLLTICLVGCVKREGGTNGSKRILSQGYFRTHFQDESQFIVESIVADLAEMTYYAKHGELPAAASFAVDAREKPSSRFGQPSYEIGIVFGAGQPSVKSELTVTNAIWAPEVYEPVVKALFDSLALSKGEARGKAPDDFDLLFSLTTLTAAKIEKENQAVSQRLTKNFKFAELHENAALILGAFALREESEDFFDVRSPLCRMTAHLALARGLAGHPDYTVNGRAAEALLSALMNNQKAALEKIAQFDQAQPALAAWGRALKARVTGDFRVLDGVKDPSLIERIERFRGRCRSADTQSAWKELDGTDVKKIPDFCRIANGSGSSVETGHELLARSLPLEFAEVGQVFALARGAKLEKEQFMEALNELPERCFGTRGDAIGKVRIIGWGQWAMFLQRHLCHTLQQNFDFLENKWGVHDEARAFARKSDQTFANCGYIPLSSASTAWISLPTISQSMRPFP